MTGNESRDVRPRPLTRRRARGGRQIDFASRAHHRRRSTGIVARLRAQSRRRRARDPRGDSRTRRARRRPRRRRDRDRRRACGPSGHDRRAQFRDDHAHAPRPVRGPRDLGAFRRGRIAAPASDGTRGATVTRARRGRRDERWPPPRNGARDTNARGRRLHARDRIRASEVGDPARKSRCDGDRAHHGRPIFARPYGAHAAQIRAHDSLRRHDGRTRARALAGERYPCAGRFFRRRVFPRGRRDDAGERRRRARGRDQRHANRISRCAARAVVRFAA